MKWHVTTHAIERLMGRVDRTITTKQAEDALYRQLDVAVKLDKLTRHGQGYYQIQAFGQPVLVIGKHDPAIRRMVAVSVLRVDEVEEEAEDTTDEVVAAYQRAQKAGTVVPFMDVSNGEMKRGVKVDELQRKIAALEAHVAVLQLEAARAEEDRERVALERRYLEKQNREAAAMLTETPTAGMMRKLARAMAHGEKMEREREEQRPILRVAIRALYEIDAAGHSIIAIDAMEKLCEMASGYVSLPFLYPERFTREERQAAGRVAEGAEALTVPA